MDQRAAASRELQLALAQIGTCANEPFQLHSIRETQEMLDFCGEHKVTADIDIIEIQQINQAYERLLNNDVKYRFVIDLASLK